EQNIFPIFIHPTTWGPHYHRNQSICDELGSSNYADLDQMHAHVQIDRQIKNFIVSEMFMMIKFSEILAFLISLHNCIGSLICTYNWCHIGLVKYNKSEVLKVEVSMYLF
ncbi:hypothetical protein ACJX0J_032005, partial [Zea mays]